MPLIMWLVARRGGRVGDSAGGSAAAATERLIRQANTQDSQYRWTAPNQDLPSTDMKDSVRS